MAGPASPATATPPQREPPTSSTLSTGAFTLCGGSDAYGRHVSRPMENRTAVFAAQPQSVEVYQAGAWWAGELLGWRHDDSGTCQVWVRVVLGGVEETAWMDLAGLRLPERHLTVAPEPSVVPDASSTQKLPRATSPRRGPSGRRPTRQRRRACRWCATCPSSVAAPVAPGGRRRAPERSRAAAPSAPRAGGRRRAPESPETAVAAAAAQSPSPSSSSGGRRRAPEDSVRRRGDRGGAVRRRGAPPRRAARRPRAAPQGGHGTLPRGRRRARRRRLARAAGPSRTARGDLRRAFAERVGCRR